MYEVEVKVRADRETVRSRLADSDADSLGRVRQVDTYFNAPHRDFAKTDEALRVRRETRYPSDGGENPAQETRVTYKGPKVDDDSKTREEFETGIEDGETFSTILARMGFTRVADVEKNRERFELGGYTVTLDRVEDVGEFVEVDRQARESEVETVREGAFDVLEALGLDPADQVRTSYLELLLEFR